MFRQAKNEKDGFQLACLVMEMLLTFARLVAKKLNNENRERISLIISYKQINYFIYIIG